jgi:hypothetical protein
MRAKAPLMTEGITTMAKKPDRDIEKGYSTKQMVV